MQKLTPEQREHQKNQKQKLLNEEIISKGYNPEDLSNFIMRTKGIPPDFILYDDYITIIEDFKNDQLKQTYSFVNSKKKKEETLFEVFYAPEKYNLKCAKQEETPISPLKTVQIFVSEPIKTEGRFFTSYYTFLISCKELNLISRKSYNDIEWLKNKLSEYYPFVLIPPLPKNSFFSSDAGGIDSRLRYLNMFFEGLCRKKILRTSKLLYNFISLQDDEFNKYKESFSKATFTLDNELTNYPTNKGEVNFELTRDIAIVSNAFKTSLSPMMSQYNKLNNLLVSLSNDFISISNRMNEIKEICINLEKEAKTTRQCENIQKLFKSFTEIFDIWSKGYIKQSTMINTDFKEYFTYMNMELSTIHNIYESFNDVRNEYEITGQKLKDKKDNLYENKNYAKWDLDPNNTVDVVILEKDKKQAYDAMCYKETKNNKDLKKKLCFIMNMMIWQYGKLCKYQGERSKKFIEHLAISKPDILSDAFTLIKLFSIQLI